VFRLLRGASSVRLNTSSKACFDSCVAPQGLDLILALRRVSTPAWCLKGWLCWWLTAQRCYVHFLMKLRFWYWVIARAFSHLWTKFNILIRYKNKENDFISSSSNLNGCAKALCPVQFSRMLFVQPRPTLGHFTFWISLSLSVSLSPKVGLRPKISQKVKLFFFVWTQRLAKTKLRTERSLNPKLINSPVDFA